MSAARYSAENERLRALLRQCRKESGLTQGELAARLGVPQSWVSKVESGERLLSFVEVGEVCRALAVDLVDFMRAYQGWKDATK
ncbi:MAG: helix-turn-helix transcriptional regulator [Bacteroidota bacterium]